MSDFCHVRRRGKNLAGREYSTEGFEELGFCAFHASESWKREHGMPFEARKNMELGGERTYLRFDPDRGVLEATVLTRGRSQETFCGKTLEELTEQILRSR